MKKSTALVKPEQMVFQIIAKQAPTAPRAPRAMKAAPPPPINWGKALRNMPKVNSKRIPSQDALQRMFRVARPMPGVLPKGHKLAMDDAINAYSGYAMQNFGGVSFEEGYVFQGYPYLAQLTTIPEYRLISETISGESTRKWIKIKSQSEDDGKAEKIKELEEEFQRLKVKETFRVSSLYDGFFGRSHIYINTGATDQPDELKTPIGDGNNFSKKKVRKGSLRALKVIEPIWTYPQWYNAVDPLADDWYDPTIWYVMGKGVHKTRMLPMISRPMPDLLKPAFQFGGLAMSQMAKPYIDNWLETRQSVNQIIQAFSVMVLKTNLQAILEKGGSAMMDRVNLFNGTRNNDGTLVIDKNSEDFANISAPITGLDKLQAQAQEHMSAVSRIPLVKLTGISPSGLNATSEQELEVFDETIHDYQENIFRAPLTTIFKLAQINIWGQVDEDLTFDFEPLSELTEMEVAELQKAKSETHKNYVDASIIAPEEVRQSLVDDSDSPYAELVADDVPEPILESEHVKEAETGTGTEPGAEGGQSPETGESGEAEKPDEDDQGE